MWQQLILRIVRRCCQLARRSAEALLLARLENCWHSQRLLGSVLELSRRNLPIDLLLLRELSAAWSVAAAQASVVMAKSQICFSFFTQNNQAICQEDALCLEVSKSFLLSRPTCSLYSCTALQGRFCLTGGEMERDTRKTKSGGAQGEWVKMLGWGQRERWQVPCDSFRHRVGLWWGKGMWKGDEITTPCSRSEEKEGASLLKGSQQRPLLFLHMQSWFF